MLAPRASNRTPSPLFSSSRLSASNLSESGPRFVMVKSQSIEFVLVWISRENEEFSRRPAHPARTSTDSTEPYPPLPAKTPAPNPHTHAGETAQKSAPTPHSPAKHKPPPHAKASHTSASHIYSCHPERSDCFAKRSNHAV